jgi:hypothetical protein
MIVALVLGAGLGAGLYAVLDRVLRWDSDRRLAGGLAAAAAARADAGEPAAIPVPATGPAAAGRHCRGDDTLTIASTAFRAGLSARGPGGSPDPYQDYRRPSAMIPVQPSMLPDLEDLEPGGTGPHRPPADVAPVWADTWAPESAGSPA